MQRGMAGGSYTVRSLGGYTLRTCPPSSGSTVSVSVAISTAKPSWYPSSRLCAQHALPPCTIHQPDIRNRTGMRFQSLALTVRLVLWQNKSPRRQDWTKGRWPLLGGRPYLVHIYIECAVITFPSSSSALFLWAYGPTPPTFTTM